MEGLGGTRGGGEGRLISGGLAFRRGSCFWECRMKKQTKGEGKKTVSDLILGRDGDGGYGTAVSSVRRVRVRVCLV